MADTIKALHLGYDSGTNEKGPWECIQCKFEYQGKIYSGPVWLEKSSRGVPLQLQVVK